jgi:branched-chain amino acid transport system substrate-binding protein
MHTLQATRDVRKVSLWLGHAGLHSTEVYLRADPTEKLAGVQALLTAYQARAPEAQVDLLGHYMAPLAYAQMQVVSQAVAATGGFDDMALAACAHTATFHTVVGDITFETNGEWSTPRVLQVQFRGIVDHEVEQDHRVTSGPRLEPASVSLSERTMRP